MEILLWDYDKLLDIKLVRWLSQFFSQERLSPIIDWFRQQLEQRGALGLSTYFLRWAIILVIISFAIDMTLHWTKHEQKIAFRRFVAHVRIYWRKFTIFVKDTNKKITATAKRAKR